MSASFVVYIDESGDEGFAFKDDNGSSEWFVIAAIITEKEHDLETVQLINRVRNIIHRQPKQTDPLHFKEMRHEHRKPLIGEIAAAKLRTVAVMIHKPSLTTVESFQQRNRLYYHASRYLLERFSWCCRDSKTSHTSGDGTAEIQFSHRGGLKTEELRQYMNDLKNQTSQINVSIDWNVIDTANIQVTSGKSMGQQIADAVASGFYFSVRSQYGYTETQYAEMLKPVVYHHKGRYRGYGIKIWPRNYDTILHETIHWSWLQQTYDFK